MRRLSERLQKTLGQLAPLDIVIHTASPFSATIQFKPEATQQQRDAANAALASFDPSQAAQDAWEEDQKPERKTLRQAAVQAVNDIDTYLAISNPNNAQVVAQVRRLSQLMRAVIRRLVQID